MKKILIPTDFSPSSYQAIDYVLQLFKSEYCEFYFLNRYSYNVSGLDAMELLQADDVFFEKPEEDSMNQLLGLLDKYKAISTHKRHTFYAISENTGLVYSIKNNIEKIGIDLLIITDKVNESLGSNTTSILNRIKCCAILIVPPNATMGNGVCMTIASDFKQRINTSDIDKFKESLKSTNLEIGILVLEEQGSLTQEVKQNLDVLTRYLNHILHKPITIEYIQGSYTLKDFAIAHLDGIMCLIDKKPDLLCQMGLYKSNLIAKLKTIGTSTVFTIHQ